MKQALILFLTALWTIPALANSPEPSDKDIAQAAQTCTAEGAFGIRFGARNTTSEGRDAGITPFRIETVSARRDGVFEITGLAWFGKAPMSQEDRVSLAGWYFRKLDSEIAATRKFVNRQDRRDGVAFQFERFVLDLSQDGVSVRLACTDSARKRSAREEMKH